jgi:hypothetical protein
LDDLESSEPTDMVDIDRGVDGGEEFVEAVKPADRLTDNDAVDLAVGEDGSLVDLEMNGSGSRRIPSVLML